MANYKLKIVDNNRKPKMVGLNFHYRTARIIKDLV